MRMIQSIRLLLVRAVEHLIIALGAAFTLIVLYAVASRYLFGLSLTWIEEVVRFLIAWIVFLGISVGLYGRAHVSMQAIFQSLPKDVQKVVLLGTDVLILLFLAIVLHAGTNMALSALPQRSPVTGISYFRPYLSLPVGAALGIIQSLFLIWDDIAELRSGH